MPFLCFGGAEPADWILQETGTLASMAESTVSVVAAQVARKLTGGEPNYGDLREESTRSRFSTSDARSVMSCMHYIFLNAASHNVSGETLESELEMLGLSTEHAASMASHYTQDIPSYIENNDQWPKVLDAALTSLNKWRFTLFGVLDNKYILQRVESIATQVVSGVNTKVVLKLSLGTVLERHEFEVYRDFDGKCQVTSHNVQ
ncbi:hypertension-related calcium-regulated gene protein [Kipferlia bialata]|uniref:Hypertension-related calcium-regulated gene protein n=1 Tax=Kipferlia bialata TaxID=797122 RepID=A0A391NJ89_9EUKA|nr:hypertension-related calcium-regulated gene protein [Kipferlia bialata]|eukprot:g2216.t1